MKNIVVFRDKIGHVLHENFCQYMCAVEIRKKDGMETRQRTAEKASGDFFTAYLTFWNNNDPGRAIALPPRVLSFFEEIALAWCCGYGMWGRAPKTLTSDGIQLEIDVETPIPLFLYCEDKDGREFKSNVTIQSLYRLVKALRAKNYLEEIVTEMSKNYDLTYDAKLIQTACAELSLCNKGWFVDEDICEETYQAIVKKMDRDDHLEKTLALYTYVQGMLGLEHAYDMSCAEPQDHRNNYFKKPVSWSTIQGLVYGMRNAMGIKRK